MAQTGKALPNPFTPVFGKIPPHMAGRRPIIDAILQALDEGTNSPDVASLVVGARGTGKTALLSYLSVEAAARGWISVDVTASPGMLEELLQQTARSASHLLPPSGKKRITGFQLAGVAGMSWENEGEAALGWRMRMEALLDGLADNGVGVFITVDEVDPRNEELRQLVNTFQHFMREDRKVALLMAGLPHNVSLLVSEYTTTFLRRAARHNLGPIPDYEVEEAFRLTVEQGGRRIDPEALSLAVQAVDGFAFMFQLVGYRSWNSSPQKSSISLEDMQRGVALARAELKDRVYDATLAELAAGDVAFLQAMLQDDGDTSQVSLKGRLGKSSSHVSTYKRRLLDQGIIDEPRKGTLRFCLPGFREYLIESFGVPGGQAPWRVLE